MNIYTPTGKKVESWPQWVGRLSEENLHLKRENEKFKQQIKDLETESFELKKRSCDLWSEVMEVKASYAK
jgi:regulator of replication initiation timing